VCAACRSVIGFVDNTTSRMQSYFNSLDDEIIIQILSHLGTTVCLGTPPERRAALVPIQNEQLRASTDYQAPVIVPEFSIHLENAPVDESSCLLLHTPQLHLDDVRDDLPNSSHCATTSSSSSASRWVPTTERSDSLQYKLVSPVGTSCRRLKRSLRLLAKNEKKIKSNPHDTATGVFMVFSYQIGQINGPIP
jgi:hypothetical protein